MTWASWFGSPSRRIERAAPPIASTVASESWPASSTTRSPRRPSIASRANSQAVPADHVDGAGRDRRLDGIVRRDDLDPGEARAGRVVVALLDDPDRLARPRSPRRAIASQRVRDGAVRLRRDPDRPEPGVERRRGSSARPCRSCPCPAGPGRRGRRLVEVHDEPARRVEGRLVRSPERSAGRGRGAQPRRTAEEQVAGRPVRPVRVDAPGDRRRRPAGRGLAAVARCRTANPR